MESLLSFLLSLLGNWYIWMPIAAVFGYLAFRNNQRAKVVQDQDHKLLLIEIPSTNDKPAQVAQELFASLHGMLRSRRELAAQGGLQEHISFEIAAIERQIRFYVWVPAHLQSFVEGQIYAQYPNVRIVESPDDYTERKVSQGTIYATEMVLSTTDTLPIKTLEHFESDPLQALTGALAKLQEADEEMWVQIMLRPIANDWHRKTQRFITRVKSGAGKGTGSTAGQYMMEALSALSKPPTPSSTPAELNERENLRVTEAEKKANKPGFRVKIRLIYLGNDPNNAKLRMQAVTGTFMQYNAINLNGFKMKREMFGSDGLAEYRARFFIDRGFILNSDELASLFHIPHAAQKEVVSNIWASGKTVEPPAMLPLADSDSMEVSAFGLTTYRGAQHQFGLQRSDRSRHVYIVGQTGTGKSALLELLALSDLFHGHGYAIIDPHGDLATENLRFIPQKRLNDIVYFNPADTAHPLGFNPMEITNPAMKSIVSSEIVGVIKRMFGTDWHPQLEYTLRYTVLALLDYPHSTLLDIPRMFNDPAFRTDVIKHCKDVMVQQFWTTEFTRWDEAFMAHSTAPILNKVGAFTANPIIRNIIGQPTSTFNFRNIMDQGKIVIINLSKGLIGEDNAAILGAFLIAKIQLAAMSRSDIAQPEDRRPFYLYVDEFQNFATDSFVTILSEARKYGLHITVANQYISQMAPSVRDAVFGNVGTVISFRPSPDDAPTLAKQFEPTFMPTDLMQLHNRQCVISMVIRGEKATPFAGHTLTLPHPHADLSQQIIAHTRHYYSRPRKDVEAHITHRLQQGGGQ